MHLLYEEWNDSAMAVVFIMALLPLIPAFLLTKWMLRQIPNFKQLMETKKQEQSFLYPIILLGVLLLSAVILYGVLFLFNYRNC